MTTLIYDGSWTGFLSCIFEVYERRLQQVRIVRKDSCQTDFFSDNVPVHPDIFRASRVIKGLRERLSSHGLLDFYACYLSGLPQIEDWLLQYARLIFSSKGAEHAFADNVVLKVSQTARMVLRESHRMKGFVRFALTKDGFYFATIEPDFNVIPLIAPHFKKRFADQQWIIYDCRRKFGIHYDLKSVAEISFQFTTVSDPRSNHSVFTESEVEYQKLWTEYYKSTDIDTRKNTRLMLQHLPRRYWKYLTEKIGSLDL